MMQQVFQPAIPSRPNKTMKPRRRTERVADLPVIHSQDEVARYIADEGPNDRLTQGGVVEEAVGVEKIGVIYETLDCHI